MRAGIMNWIDHKRYRRSKRRQRMAHFVGQTILVLAALVVFTMGIGVAVSVYFNMLAVAG